MVSSVAFFWRKEISAFCSRTFDSVLAFILCSDKLEARACYQ